jgi:hypothetical protein
MSDQNLPVTQSDDFIADLEAGNMDLSSLYDESFVVAVSTGDRNKCKLLASTLRGPYDFCTMVEQVGMMWVNHQHHAKITILHKEEGKRASFLDAGTTDYIEANYQDIAFEVSFESILDEERPIKAGVICGKEDEDEE